jgi:hypothetical protein
MRDRRLSVALLAGRLLPPLKLMFAVLDTPDVSDELKEP